MERIQEQRYAALQEFLTDVYREITSERRIKELTENLFRVLEDADVDLYEVGYFLDDFEGGTADDFRFRQIMTFFERRLSVNKKNAQRLFEYLRRSKDAIAYFLLVSDFYRFLSQEQINVLAARQAEFPTVPFPPYDRG